MEPHTRFPPTPACYLPLSREVRRTEKLSPARSKQLFRHRQVLALFGRISGGVGSIPFRDRRSLSHGRKFRAAILRRAYVAVNVVLSDFVDHQLYGMFALRRVE